MRIFKTWIIRILIRECYRIQKKRKNLVPYEEYMQDRKLWEEDRYTDLYLAIMELPQELRVLVTLYYLDGFSVREVSDILQMKEGTVKAVYQERENSSECSLETGRAYYAREGKMGNMWRRRCQRNFM